MMKNTNILKKNCMPVAVVKLPTGVREAIVRIPSETHNLYLPRAS